MLISTLINDLKEGTKPMLMVRSEDPGSNGSDKWWEKMRHAEQSLTSGVVFACKQRVFTAALTAETPAQDRTVLFQDGGVLSGGTPEGVGGLGDTQETEWRWHNSSPVQLGCAGMRSPRGGVKLCPVSRLCIRCADSEYTA